MSEITLRTKAWYGDTEESFRFPDDWDVTVYAPNNAQALDEAGIRKALGNPFGTPSLNQIAKGKKSAAIIVDDLSRPTPAGTVAPFIIEQLHEAGVPDDGIRFVVGGGAHRPLNDEEIAKKVGESIAAKYQVTNHDAYSGTLTGMGNMDDGTPVYINEVVAESDVKICLAGIYPHPSAGFGGGAKLILPGISGITTIFYNHSLFPTRGRGLQERESPVMDLREHAEKVARFIGLDMIVNTIVNSRREVAGLFVGDVVEAHRAGCRFAMPVYCTPITQRAVESTDIVIINAYPLDSDPVQTLKSIWPVEVFKNAYKAYIDDASDGIIYHGLGDGMDWGRWLSRRKPAEASPDGRKPTINSKDQMVVVSTGFQPEDFYRQFEDGALFPDWETLVEELQKVCPKGKVAVIPCAPIQTPVII